MFLVLRGRGGRWLGWVGGAASDVTIHHTKAMSATDPLSRFVYSCIANTKIPPARRMLSDLAEGFYGVMSSRLIVINEPPHFLACLSINFLRGALLVGPGSTVLEMDLK